MFWAWTFLFPHVTTKNCRSWECWREKAASSWSEARRPQPMGGTRCWLTSVCSYWCPNSRKKAFLRFSWFYQFYHHRHLWLSRSWSKFSAFPQSTWHTYYAAHRKGRKRVLEILRVSDQWLQSLRFMFCT